MTFFNKKEEVIDLELTSYGEQLLSEGIFEPEYYAFYDDNILYDASGSAGVLEIQNDIEGRIQEDTPQGKAQYLFSGVETNVNVITAINRAYALISPTFVESEQALFPPLRDRDFTLVEPMGSMALGSTYAPSWDIRVLKGELSGAINYMTSSASGGENSLVRRIPQLDFNIEYKVAVGWAPQRPAALNILGDFYDDGTYLYLPEGEPELIFSIDERNASADTEYDVEVFEVAKPPAAGVTEILLPLVFPRPPPEVVNGLLLDEEERAALAGVGTTSLWSAPDMVGYYFDVDIDRDIPEELMCELIVDLRSRGVTV